MIDKKVISNYVKLMKAMSKIAKKNDRRLLIQRVSNEVFGEIVYLTDSCAVFPIPADVYDANAEACNCPLKDNKVDLYKIIRDNDDNGRIIKPTKMLYDLNTYKGIKTVRVYISDIDYLFIDTMYTDLIDLLPASLSGYSECKNCKINCPVAFYNSNIDVGFAICPIYNRTRDDFENCLHDIEKVSYADVK